MSTPTSLDYASIKREDLEMRREPRKSTITVVHKPTGTVASDPVVPGSLAPARFRRATNLPKENRPNSKEVGADGGYIESTVEDDKQLFWIKTGGETPVNEYLDALAGDAEALKASFEGIQKAAVQPVPVTVPAIPASDVLGANSEPAPAAPVAQVDPAQAQEIDDLLAQIDK